MLRKLAKNSTSELPMFDVIVPCPLMPHAPWRLRAGNLVCARRVYVPVYSVNVSVLSKR